MLQNYLKVFLRLITRNRVFTLINLLGLSTGIACFICLGTIILQTLRTVRAKAATILKEAVMNVNCPTVFVGS